MSWQVVNNTERVLDLGVDQSSNKVANFSQTEFRTDSWDTNLLHKLGMPSNETYSFSQLIKSLASNLTNWQSSQLENVKESESGVKCLLNGWLVTQKGLEEGSFCNTTWDNVYCWPPTSVGTTVNRTCPDAFQETEPLYASRLKGHAYRICLENGIWLWGKWTNYTECADSIDAMVANSTKQGEDNGLVITIRYILFVGSILSLLFILSAITTFCSFRSLRCDRVTIHIHLMTSLLIRYIMLLVITEPLIFNRSTSYRNYDDVCRGVLIVYLYATMASVNWMFIQGIYINSKLTTNIFDGRAPFKVYYTIGWVYPFVLITIWAIIMNNNHDVHCWSGYAAMNEIWIIIFPIIFALLVNFMVLLNILRVMLTKVRTTGTNTAGRQLTRRAAKATFLLFPLLGINNLLVLYNPGGDLKKYFVIINTLLSSSQGVFVAIGYCFLSKDVRFAFRGIIRRFLVQRNASSIGRNRQRQNRRSTISAFRIRRRMFHSNSATDSDNNSANSIQFFSPESSHSENTLDQNVQHKNHSSNINSAYAHKFRSTEYLYRNYERNGNNWTKSASLQSSLRCAGECSFVSQERSLENKGGDGFTAAEHLISRKYHLCNVSVPLTVSQVTYKIKRRHSK